MKYTGEQISKKASLKKHAGHVKDNDNCYATSDGNCFIGDRAKGLAYSHAALYRPALNVFDLKAKGIAKDETIEEAVEVETIESIEEVVETVEEVTIESLMQMSANELKKEAAGMGIEYENDSNKRTIAKLILDKSA